VPENQSNRGNESEGVTPVRRQPCRRHQLAW